MRVPEIEPRDMIAIQRLVDDAVYPRLTPPQARAYKTLLASLRNAISERNRFEAEVVGERCRRARAERKLRYAHRWCGVLLAIVALELAILILEAMR